MIQSQSVSSFTMTCQGNKIVSGREDRNAFYLRFFPSILFHTCHLYILSISPFLSFIHILCNINFPLFFSRSLPIIEYRPPDHAGSSNRVSEFRHCPAVLGATLYIIVESAPLHLLLLFPPFAGTSPCLVMLCSSPISGGALLSASKT